MNAIGKIIQFELQRVVLRRSFILTLFLTPLIPFVMLLVYSHLEEGKNAPAADPVVRILEGPSAAVPEGLMDDSGLVRELPAGIEGRLVQFSDGEQARQALQDGRISALYQIHSDYISSGNITVFRQDFNPLDAVEQSDALRETIQYNLLRDYPALYRRFSNPVNLQVQTLGSTPARDPDEFSSYLVPYIIAFIFYLVIFGSASLLLNSVTEEKQNRVIEILVTSVRPLQILAGKVAALGLAGLLQMAVWGILAASFYSLLGNQASFLADAGRIPPSLLAWGVLYFLLGYAVYASLMAGLGALVSNLREASQVTLFIMMPLLLPLALVSVLVARPSAPLAVGLSLFPFTAPVTMPMRLAIGGVPGWQTALSILILAGTSVLVVRSAARIFRAQTLLSGQTFSLRLFLRALTGKV